MYFNSFLGISIMMKLNDGFHHFKSPSYLLDLLNAAQVSCHCGCFSWWRDTVTPCINITAAAVSKTAHYEEQR